MVSNRAARRNNAAVAGANLHVERVQARLDHGAAFLSHNQLVAALAAAVEAPVPALENRVPVLENPLLVPCLTILGVAFTSESPYNEIGMRHSNFWGERLVERISMVVVFNTHHL